MSGTPTPVLEASRCMSCGKHVIPLRPKCPGCGGATKNISIEGKGSILSWTIVHVTPEGIPSPRTVALVALACGAAVLCLVTDNRQLEMGAQVRVGLVDGLHQME